MTHAVLLIQRFDSSTQEVPLDKERTVIGRAPDCDIMLDGRLISRQHAVITRAGQAYTLADLGSRNGTAVNSQTISEPWPLHDGDSIELGGASKLFFVDSDSTSTRPVPSAVGVWLDEAAQEVWVDGQRLEPQLSLAQFSLLHLLVAHVDQICSRDDIVAAVWPDVSEGVSDEAIDALIKRVRARLSEVPNGQNYLKTVRGRGMLLRSMPE